MAQCVLLETGAKGFWAPNGDDGTGKPGVNHQTHQTNNTTPNFLQLWPFTRTHFHLLIGVLEIICNPWEKFDQESKEVDLRFTSRRFEKIRENELSTHRRCCQLILSAIHCRGTAVSSVHFYHFHSWCHHHYRICIIIILIIVKVIVDCPD